MGGKFDPMAMPFEDMTEDQQNWLRDQHPRGAAVIEANKAKFQMDTAETEEAPPYEEWTVKELSEEAQARGLKKSGTQEELVNRLYDHDKQNES